MSVTRLLTLALCAAPCMFFPYAASAQDESLWPTQAEAVIANELAVLPQNEDGKRPAGLTWDAAWWDSQCVLLTGTFAGEEFTQITVTYADGKPIGNSSYTIIESPQLFIGLYGNAILQPSKENQGTLTLQLTAWYSSEAEPAVWQEQIVLPEVAWLPAIQYLSEDLTAMESNAVEVIGITMTPGRCTVIWKQEGSNGGSLFIQDAEGVRYPQVEQRVGSYITSDVVSPYFGKQPLRLVIQLDGSENTTFEIPE